MLRPELLLSRDAIFGLYLATRADPGARGAVSAWAGLDRVEEAHARGELRLDETIEVRVPGGRARTTTGRALVERALPIALASAARATLRRRDVHRLLEELQGALGAREALRVSRALERLGLRVLEEHAPSPGMDDLVPWEGKAAELARASADAARVADEYRQGLITDGERYNKTVDTWSWCTDRVWHGTEEALRARQDSLFALVDSGASGERRHLQRLVAMQGLTSAAWGEIRELPIRSSLGEGLEALEHFAHASSERTAVLRERERSERTRLLRARLFGALRSVRVTEDECGTTRGRTVHPLENGPYLLSSVGEQVRGLVSLDDVWDREGRKQLLRAGEQVSAELARELDSHVDMLRVRWPASCETRGGVCRRCCGHTEASVGAEAARSIAALAGQLAGPSWGFWGQPPWQVASFTGQLRWHGIVADETERGWRVLEEGGYVSLRAELGGQTRRYAAHPGRVLCQPDGARVRRGDAFMDGRQWARQTLAVLPQGATARVDLGALAPGSGLREEVDALSGVTRLVVEASAPVELLLHATEGDAPWSPVRVQLLPGARLTQAHGALVRRGDLLASDPLPQRDEVSVYRGFDLLEELLEPARPAARVPVARADGHVRVDRARRAVWIERPGQPAVRVGVGRAHLCVRDGDWVQAGEALTYAHPTPLDQLRVRGADWMACTLADHLAATFGHAGLTATLAHLGLVVRAMLSRVRVTKTGGTQLGWRSVVTRDALDQANAAARARGAAPAEGAPVITPLSQLGTTKRASPPLGSVPRLR